MKDEEIDDLRGLRVGDWQVEAPLNRIRCGDRHVKLEPKIMQVLLVLASRPGHVFSKDDLIDAVWREAVVSDDVLARAVSELRRAFGDDRREPEFIETIYKSGYRLVAPVSHGQPDAIAGEHRRPRASRAAVSAVAIVVLVGVVALIVRQPGSRAPGPWEFTPATADPGLEVRPALAPDGRTFAYSAADAEDGNWDIYIRSTGTGQPRRLTRSAARDGGPVWSPDGRRIAYIRYSPGQCSIMAVDPGDGSESRLGACSDAAYADLDWSNDGRWLAYNDEIDAGSNHAIMLLDVVSGETRRLTEPPAADWGDYDPVFAPDGRTLYFARARSEAIQDLYAIDLASGVERQLTDDGRNLYGIDVTADGAWVLYATNRGGLRYEIWRQPAGGGDAERFLHSSTNLVNPSVAAAPGRLLVEQRSYDINLWRVSVDRPEAPTAYASSSRWEMYPAFSRDAGRVAFSSNRSGSYEIWVTAPHDARAKRLTNFSGPLSASPRWSPVDDRLVFVSRPDGNADIFLGSADDGTIVRLTDTDSDELAPSWSHDGTRVYFASNRSGEWEIWSVPADGGTPAQVTYSGGYSAHESYDGTTLYFARHAQAGIWSMPVAGGSPVRVLDGVEAGDWGNWGLFDEGVWCVERGRQPRVMGYDPVGRATALLYDLKQDFLAGEVSLALSRDGRQMIYARVDSREADIIHARLADARRSHD